ncbi:NUDIX domain-containing protein [Allosphingosinicella flava]|uniref:NUDIX domain-containing protein n=2 Tax=Allosphingosinicella flava TaxID=2771430 RepID=A0A7T2GM10_9SPHN|nr:NUDIX domain-containing protein [Sphingosinicella flava]
MGADNVIRIVAGLVMDEDGRTLLVRKRGTAAFMQPGGKMADGEEPFAALEREIREELGCGVKAGSSQELGHFIAPAANEPDCTVDAQLFAVTLDGEAKAQAEIEEAIWIDPAKLDGLTLAPLTANHVMPLAREMKGLNA